EQFPEVICELRSLRKLWMNGNKLSALPRSFANLRELRDFDISNNRFKEFPQVVCELLNLESLSVWDNQLSELPLAITKLVRLKFLDLSRNSFTSFPLFVGDLPQLSEFYSSGWFNLLVSISLSLAHNWCRQSSSRVPKVASQMPNCSDSSNSVERLLDCLPSLEEASAVRSRTRGLDFWFEDCTILDC
ncbi:MAG: leucine-rich repeat domain-containing protein, partial [Saprospiraceae bacterium]|nr:leucine-rich repeat domain-containing protein [Candidatus Vicinibacter affinis]